MSIALDENIQAPPLRAMWRPLPIGGGRLIGLVIVCLLHMGLISLLLLQTVERRPKIPPPLLMVKILPAEKPADKLPKTPPVKLEQTSLSMIQPNMIEPLPAPKSDSVFVVPHPAPSTVVPEQRLTPPPAPQKTTTPVDFASKIMAHLYSMKRYPKEARHRGETGIVMLRFTIDRAGHVLGYQIDQGSGHILLDEEVRALVSRADPFPTLPPEIIGPSLELVIPVVFSLG